MSTLTDDTNTSTIDPKKSDGRIGRASRWWERLPRRATRAVLAIIGLLVIARLALPFVILKVLNDQLAELDGYQGHVDDVDVSLWRGAYALDGLEIMKTSERRTPVPFVSMPHTDISIQWAALFEGRVVAELIVDHPVLNFVRGGGGVAEQTGEGNDWRETIDGMVPLTINRFQIVDGEVHYRDFGNTPRLDLRVDHLQLVAHGLATPSADDEHEDRRGLPADVHLTANVQHSGRLTVDARVDPWDEKPTFDLALRLRRLRAVELNTMLRAYGGVDAEDGRLSLYSEITSSHGDFHGYVKPIAEGLSVFRPDEDGDVVDLAGDAIVGLVVAIFENHGTDRFATFVPVHGSFDRPDVDGWEAVGAILYNTFIRAIEHGLQRQLDAD